MSGGDVGIWQGDFSGQSPMSRPSSGGRLLRLQKGLRHFLAQQQRPFRCEMHALVGQMRGLNYNDRFVGLGHGVNGTVDGLQVFAG